MNRRRLFLACAAAVVAPAAAFAAGDSGSVLSPNLVNSITTLVVFGLLVLILAKFAWKPIMVGLEKREENIGRAKVDAEAAIAETAKMRSEMAAERQKAHEAARTILEEARRDAERFREEERARAAADIQSDRERLRKEIESAKDQALQDIWTQAVELAALVSTKAIQRELGPDDHRRMVDEALAEMKSNVTRV